MHNMDPSELEARGAQSGFVLELDDIADAEKIQPNPIPTGLERVSFKAEEHIKTIAGVPDANTGFSREDVSAKALKANQTSSSANYASVTDNLNRTDFFLARALLDIVQTYYTEERLLHITTDPLRRETEEFKVNEVTPEGEITNDLTLGEYTIVVTNQPERDTLEDSTFAQVSEMRKELGVNFPDSVAE
jgi:zona occludens toxin (predicted ATPase)